MQVILEALQSELEQSLRLVPRLAAALLILLMAAAVGRIVGSGISRLLTRTGRAGSYPRLARQMATWIAAALGLILGLNLLGLTALAASMLATGGLVAVVLGFAFREIGENLLAGIFLAFSRSFDVGDEIESGGLRGKVRSIDLRQVHIRTADGCDIYIPSAQIFSSPLLNFTRDGLRRGGFTVGIDYGDDPEVARGLVLEAIRSVRDVLNEPAPSVVLSGFTPSYVEIQGYFWIDTFSDGAKLGAVKTEAMEASRRALRQAGFTFSSDVSTAVGLAPVQVALQGESAGGA